MTVIAFSCISLDSLYNFTHDWICYKKSYDTIEAGMTRIGSFSEVLETRCIIFVYRNAWTHAQFTGSGAQTLRGIWLMNCKLEPLEYWIYSMYLSLYFACTQMRPRWGILKVSNEVMLWSKVHLSKIYVILHNQSFLMKSPGIPRLIKEKKPAIPHCK